MRRLKKIMVLTFTMVAVLGATISMYNALHSSLFLVQVVEVADLAESAPVDAQTITQLAAIPTGLVNLFDLDLRAVEQRVLANHWIREVHLQKRFPQTLAISVVFREPQAIFQGPNGSLAYIDSDGKVFGKVSLFLQSDLPILYGFNREPLGRFQDALNLLKSWEKSSIQSLASIASMSWSAERGYRVLISYGIGPKPESTRNRVMVDLGQEIDGQVDVQLKRLNDVIRYLGTNQIVAQQIFADAGKKIVVKTVRGS